MKIKEIFNTLLDGFYMETLKIRILRSFNDDETLYNKFMEETITINRDSSWCFTEIKSIHKRIYKTNFTRNWYRGYYSHVDPLITTMSYNLVEIKTDLSRLIRAVDTIRLENILGEV